MLPTNGVECKIIDINDRDITYYVFPIKEFSLKRLKSGFVNAAIDFSHFYHIPQNLPLNLLALESSDINYGVVNEVLLKSPDGRTHFFDLNCLFKFWAMRNSGEESAINLKLIDELVSSKEGYYLTAPTEFTQDRKASFATIGSIGYLSQTAKEFSDNIVIASGYSTITPNECVFPYQNIRDPIGLRIENGVVTNPPAYNRPSIISQKGKVLIRSIDIKQTTFELSCFSDLPHKHPDLQVFNISTIGATTSKDLGAVDLILIENRIVAAVMGGGASVPYSGAVLRISSSNDLKEIFERLRQNNLVRIRLRNMDDVEAALQCGPMLVQNGEIVFDDNKMQVEQFRGEVCGAPVVPSTLQYSAGTVKAARSLVGVGADGGAKGMVVEGTTTLSAVNGVSNIKGATFEEMALIACTEGLKEAMALDSGGSVGLYSKGIRLIDSGDIRWKEALRTERPLAHVLIIK